MKPKTNKSLMLNGKGLNLKDRYTVLNRFLDFDKIVHPLNIGELERNINYWHIFFFKCDKVEMHEN
jgi:hypothetical protein